MKLLPYTHSPEEDTAESDTQPWTIHVPVQPLPWPDEPAELEPSASAELGEAEDDGS